MRPLFLILLFFTLITSCSKDSKLEDSFIKTPPDYEYPIDNWDITDGATDANNKFKRAFVKDDLLYIVDNDSYKIIDKNNSVVKTVAFDTTLDYNNFSIRFNQEYIVVADPQHIMIKHLQSGTEKYINIDPSTMGKLRINGGEYANLFFSEYNNLYYHLDKYVSGTSNYTNYAYKIRFANNTIILDSVPRITYNTFMVTTGSRYLILPGLLLFDDLTKTYSNLDNNYVPIDLHIKETNGAANFISYSSGAGNTLYLSQLSNGITTHVAIANETQYALSVNAFCVSDNTLYFATEYYGLLSFDLVEKTFNVLKQDTRREWIKEIIPYNDRLYLVTSAGLISKSISDL